MAYSTANPPVMLFDSVGGSAQRAFTYASTHTSTEILATGFFAGVGAGSRGLQGIGMRVGDLLCNRASTDASIGGRVTWHSVISATADQASTSVSSGWNAAYNVTVASAT